MLYVPGGRTGGSFAPAAATIGLSLASGTGLPLLGLRLVGLDCGIGGGGGSAVKGEETANDLASSRTNHSSFRASLGLSARRLQGRRSHTLA